MEIKKGDFLTVVGPSGCGKTTILRLMAGLSPVSSGSILVANYKVTDLNQESLVNFRSAYIGLVFQDFQLIQTLTCLENVMLPAELAEVPSKEAYYIARNELIKVGLEKRLDHYPLQLSGGEQQRTTWARAFVNNPSIIIADEPTANLDLKTQEFINDKLTETLIDPEITTVCSTHEEYIQNMATCHLIFNEETQVFDFFRLTDPPAPIEEDEEKEEMEFVERDY
jgi:putative ABC transport system ATP-binding protein